MSDDLNPYRPPMADVSGVPDAPVAGAIESSKGRRICTLLVDYVAYMAFSFLGGIAIGLAAVMNGRDPENLSPLFNWLYGATLYFLYYFVLESTWGRTLGKLACGTVVVDLDGRRPAARTIALRTLCRFIPFEPFSFFGPRGWHDGLSHTRVVLVPGR